MNLVKLSKYFGLYNLYVSMFQCFTETNGWPGISAGFLCNICRAGELKKCNRHTDRHAESMSSNFSKVGIIKILSLLGN